MRKLEKIFVLHKKHKLNKNFKDKLFCTHKKLKNGLNLKKKQYLICKSIYYNYFKNLNNLLTLISKNNKKLSSMLLLFIENNVLDCNKKNLIKNKINILKLNKSVKLAFYKNKLNYFITKNFKINYKKKTIKIIKKDKKFNLYIKCNNYWPIYKCYFNGKLLSNSRTAYKSKFKTRKFTFNKFFNNFFNLALKNKSIKCFLYFIIKERWKKDKKWVSLKFHKKRFIHYYYFKLFYNKLKITKKFLARNKLTNNFLFIQVWNKSHSNNNDKLKKKRRK